MGDVGNFIMRGNIIDLAIGIIIGAAFSAIVNFDIIFYRIFINE